MLTAWAMRAPGCAARVVADKTISFLVLTYLVYTTSLVVCGFGLRFGVFPGPDPFTLTVIPATLALIVITLGLSIAFVPTDLQRRLQTLAPQRPHRPHRPAAGDAPGRDLGRHPRRAHHLRSRDPALLGAITFWAFQIAVLWAASMPSARPRRWRCSCSGFFIGMLGNLLPLPGGSAASRAG